MAHWGHAVLAPLKATCLLLSHAVCVRTLGKFICSLSDCWHLLGTDAESTSSSPVEVGHPSCCPVRHACSLLSYFPLTRSHSQGVPFCDLQVLGWHL